MIRNIRSIVRKLDYTQTEQKLDEIVLEVTEAVNNGQYDFSSFRTKVLTKNGKKRKVYHYDSLSVENILCHYLKREIDKTFQVRYSSRSKIMRLFFNTLPVIKDMNDFVIIRADFSDFFNSVLTRHVYSEYIQNSSISRADKDVLKEYVNTFQYCYAGLCLSNELAEIVCRDFDRLIKAKLEQYGIFFYERYVDDILIMLKKYLDKATFLKIADEAIKDIFGKCPVKLSKKTGKFSYISCRDIQKEVVNNELVVERITFLGYEFYIKCCSTQGKKSFSISFQYGISKEKRERYEHIIEQAYIDFKKNGNEELFRQRLKIFSSRIVIPRSLGNKRIEWLTSGIISNYGELRYHIEDLESDTKKFLQSTLIQLFVKHDLQMPYFMKAMNGEESIYNLYSNLKRNRSIVFDKKIGVQREDITRWIRRIQPHYSNENKRYYQIVMEFFEMLKLNNGTISEEMVPSETV